ncbi:aquaporin-like protein [Apiospora sp. TS-2023a]
MSRRLPFLNWLPIGVKNYIIVILSEFSFPGTFLFLLFAFGGSCTNAINSAPTAGEPLNAIRVKLLYILL